MRPQRTPEQLAQLFADVFEADKRGEAVLDHLVQVFAREPAGAGLDRAVALIEYAGRRQVLDYILRQINRANGVEDAPSADIEG